MSVANGLVKNTITVSRQLGSLGREISETVAQRLGFRVVRRELINQAARLAGTPEVALAAIDELGLIGLSPSIKDLKAYRQAVEQVMHELVAEGNVVIIGRAGQVILAGHPCVLHIRLFAPIDVRVSRVASQQSISPEAAMAQVEASDANRQKFMKRFCQSRWENPDLYDLLLNTSRFTISQAAEVIISALQQSQE